MARAGRVALAALAVSARWAQREPLALQGLQEHLVPMALQVESAQREPLARTAE